MAENTVLTDEEKDDTETQDQDIQKEEENKDDEELLDTKDKDSDDADESKDDGAPDEYTEFSLPEDFEVDDKVMGDFKSFAKDVDLSQKQAQKLVDMQTSLNTQTVDNIKEQVAKIQNDWQKSAKSDKEFGGKDLDTNLGFAAKAIDKFGSDKMRDALNATGVGNHPEFIRFLVNVGKAMSEDGVLTEGTTPGGDKSHAEILFPEMPKGE